jgi:hypothetical protein
LVGYYPLDMDHSEYGFKIGKQLNPHAHAHAHAHKICTCTYGVVHAWVGQILLNCDVFKRVIRPAH